ncbi:MAG: histidine kinase dimerization/phospho-acceptor domain-containing protein [Micavibrio sp.]
MPVPEKTIRDVGHDLNNILASIIGNAEFLQEDLMPGSPQHRFAVAIQRGGVEALALVAKMLEGVEAGD